MFNECIKKRYIESGYKFCVVTFKNSDLGIVNLRPDYVINADITFEESSPYTCKDWRYADFKELASKSEIDRYSDIVLGGFHCFDCVERFANEIYKLNKNIIIDTDLTELFRNSYLYQKDFKFEKFNPDLKLKDLLASKKYIPLSALTKQKERYQNPIWGVSSKTIQNLESKIQNQKEETVIK